MRVRVLGRGAEIINDNSNPAIKKAKIDLVSKIKNEHTYYKFYSMNVFKCGNFLAIMYGVLTITKQVCFHQNKICL